MGVDTVRTTVVALTIVLTAACGVGDQSAPESSPTRPAERTAQPATSPPAATETVTITTTETAQTPSARPSDKPLVAEPGGLRAVTLGEPLDRVVAEMNARFGPPDADTGWEPAGTSSFGVCPGATEGAQVRGIRWSRIRLLFSDGPTSYGSDGYEHVFAYDLTSFEGSGTVPTTAEDIGLGSTVEELRDAYGDRLEIRPGDGALPDRFTVRFGRTGEISGSLRSTDPDGEITFVGAGLPCGE